MECQQGLVHAAHFTEIVDEVPTLCPIIMEVKKSGQIITTSAEVTLNGGLIRELPQNPLNSGLGIILICPDRIVTFQIVSYFH